MTIVHVTLDDLCAGIRLPTGEVHKLVLKRIPAHFIELSAGFARGSALLLPDGGRRDAHAWLTSFAILKQVLQYAETYPEKKLLVVGHADTEALSEARATVVCALLKGDCEQWASVVERSHGPRDIQRLLRWAARDHGYACDPGVADGTIGPKTERAKRYFSESYNNEFGTSLSTSGPLTSDHWKAFFNICEISLAHFLHVERSQLAEMRSKLSFLSEPLLWCGDQWPASSVQIPGLRSRSDERVDCVFFDETGFPPLQHQTPPGYELYGMQLRFRRGAAEVSDPISSILRLDPQIDEPHLYRLQVGDTSLEGRVEPKAFITCKLKTSEGMGELFLWPARHASFEEAEEEAVHWELELRAVLSPITTMAGAEIRLRNLGYECGECNGEGDHLTQSALRSFQEQALGSANGEFDEATRSALKHIYGA